MRTVEGTHVERAQLWTSKEAYVLSIISVFKIHLLMLMFRCKYMHISRAAILIKDTKKEESRGEHYHHNEIRPVITRFHAVINS